MKKELFLAGSLALFANAINSCGGSSRGLSGDIPVFNTVAVSITSANPQTLEVDMVAHVLITTATDVNFGFPNCNQVTTTTGVCIGYDIPSEVVNFTFSSNTIKNAAGQPATPNPSPVLIRKVSYSFSNCVSGTYEFPVGVVVNPDTQAQAPVQLFTQDMKRNLLTWVPYEYTNLVDGCKTVFQIPSYRGICTAVASLNFEVVELSSGIVRNIPYQIVVRLSDYNSPNDQCRPF